MRIGVFAAVAVLSFAEAWGIQADDPEWVRVAAADSRPEDGSGTGFVTRNNAHRPACGSDERRSYYPQYMQQVYDTDLDKLLICTDPAKRIWRDTMGTVVK